MRVPGFSDTSWEYVESILFQEADLTGQCDQREKREIRKKQRTPAQQQADQTRSQNMQGKAQGGNRSEAAKKAAQTRQKCKGVSSPTSAFT